MFMSVLGVIALVGGIAMTCCASATEVDTSVDDTIQQINEDNASELGW